MVSQAVRFRRLELPSGVLGQVYLHSMPGRREEWHQFEAAAANAQIQGIVCLTDDAEIATKSKTYAVALQSNLAFTLHRFPIRDYAVPDDEDAFAAFVVSIADRVRAGERLLTHCGAGYGRTGTFASCLLLALGCTIAEARAVVAAAGSRPERAVQEKLVERFAARQGA